MHVPRGGEQLGELELQRHALTSSESMPSGPPKSNTDTDADTDAQRHQTCEVRLEPEVLTVDLGETLDDRHRSRPAMPGPPP